MYVKDSLSLFLILGSDLGFFPFVLDKGYGSTDGYLARSFQSLTLIFFPVVLFPVYLH